MSTLTRFSSGLDMSHSELLQQCLLALSRFFVGDAPMDETLHKVVDLAAQAVPGAEMVGLTMMVDNKPATAFYSDPSMVEIDRSQYDAGEGPCVHAYLNNEVVLMEVVEKDSRWPQFTKIAEQFGIKSTLSLPMDIGGNSIGGLNFYSPNENSFNNDSVGAGTVFAEQAAIVLANAQAYWQLHDLNQNLKEAPEGRAVIEQAKGILMARSKVDADRAFDLLISASQKSNRKLREIAAELVSGVTST